MEKIVENRNSPPLPMKPDSSRDQEETDHQQLAVIVRGRDDTIGVRER